MTTIATLKEIYAEKIRQEIEENSLDRKFAVRIKRSISWLERAKKTDDQDSKFALLWIAFNALYAIDHHSCGDTKERLQQAKLFSIIKAIDSEHEICKLIEEKCLDEAKNVVSNRYIMREYWDYVMNNNLQDGQEKHGQGFKKRWKDKTDNKRDKLVMSIKDRDILPMLGSIFGNLYILRNQIIHGCATWQSKKHRDKPEEKDMDQVDDGCKVLEMILPLFIELLMENPYLPRKNLGTIGYPPYLLWHEDKYFLSLLD